MPVYTVHEPPLKAGEASADPERFVFVRDGFAFWAFLLMPLWLIAKRLWLALLGYVLLIAAITVISPVRRCIAVDPVLEHVSDRRSLRTGSGQSAALDPGAAQMASGRDGRRG